MARAQRPLSQLPLLEDTWLIGASHLKAWVKEEEDSLPMRPYLILIASNNTGLLCGSNILPETPTAVQIAEVLFKAMRHPPRQLSKACRPQKIALADAALLEPLQLLLRKESLETEIFVAAFPDEFYEIIRELEEHLREGQPEMPAMLEAPNVTPELLRGVFQAAAEFYRAAPWIYLSNDQIIAVQHPNRHDYRYALVMGQGGVEYGLVMYTDLSEVTNQSMYDNDPLSGWSARTWHSLFYDTADQLPFADLEAIEQHNFEIASQDTHPVGVVIEGPDQIRRPNRQEWEWYEAALRVIPVVVREHLHPDSHGDYKPIDTTISVKTQQGTMKIGVKYPAIELSLEDQPVERPDWEEMEAESDELPAFDRRSLEGMMSGLVTDLETQSAERDPALVRAQQVMYRAWEETNPARRIALAHEALSLSAHCADAYVLLAEEEADTLKRALDLYKQGTEAGAGALGAEYFQKNAGHFWGLFETRPYMRARQGLAQTLWHLKRYEEAIEHYHELLRLNPGDNQGNRYALLDLLMQIGRNDEARALLKQYRDEGSATWLYSRALLEFQRSGASAVAKRYLRQALQQNPYVPAYLTGQKRVPNQSLDYYGWGDESEAIFYASEHLNYWRRIPGAVEWLGAEVAAGPSSQRAASHHTHKRRRN